MTSVLSKTDIPRDRVDALHILRLNEDDIDELNPDQKKKIRELYFLDSDKTIEELVRNGVIIS